MTVVSSGYGSRGGRDGGRGGRSGGRGRGGRGGRGGRTFERDEALDLPLVLYDKRPFRDEQDMIRFMRAASACDATLLNELLLQLGNDGPVKDKFRKLVAFRFDARSGTFQNIALSLLKLLASRNFLESIHMTDMKRVLRIVLGEPLFFRRVLNCIQNEAASVESWGETVSAVDTLASVLHAMVRKLPDTATDDEFYDLVVEVDEMVRTKLQTDNKFQSAASSLAEALEICIEMVPTRRPVSSAATTNYLVQGMRNLQLVQVNAATGGFEHGRRHDNDDENFRNIRVIPVDLEMRCLEPPYLPTQLPVGAILDQRLEFHFRLLREDVLAQIRRGVQWALRSATLAQCLQTNQWKPPRGENVPMLNVAMDARLEGLEGSIYKGVMLRISAAQPAGALRGKNKDGLRNFWSREKRYQAGSLVCIATNVGALAPTDNEQDEGDGDFPRYADLGANELVFATVGDSRLEDLTSSRDRFSIRLQLLETHRAAELVVKLTDPKHMNLLFEVRGLLFTAYAPTLQSLQRLESHSISIELQQSLFGDRAQQQIASQIRPAYTQRLPTYNLQSLVLRGKSLDLSRVPVVDYIQLRDYLAQRIDSLTLDASQIDAFAAALTQPVCLIQGPPGTGKSYVGTKIVKAILDQRSAEIGPILCVCYTNHALDQFLEGLISEGLPVEQIVRVGSRSKSEVLEGRSLNRLVFGEQQSRQERYRFGRLRGECETIEEDVLKDFVTSTASTGSFLRWVQDYKPKEYAEIMGLEDEDGYQAQGQSNKDRRKRWQQWRDGKRLPGAEQGTIWRLPLPVREACLKQWETEWKESTRETIHSYLDDYNEKVAEVQQLNDSQKLRLLRTSKVVGVTTTGAAINRALLCALAPEIIVCEEAGEVLEAHLLSCLSSATQHVIQIGDHMQLRPIVNEYALSFDCPGGRYNLDVSMFERLVRERTGTATVSPGSLVTLDVQRRMRPEICDLIRRTLYPQLRDGPNVEVYPDTRGFEHNLWFLDHDHPEDPSSLSHTNPFEADMVVELVAYALKQGYTMDEITILTPYLGQVMEIRKRLSARNFRFALDEKDVTQLRNAGMLESDEDDGDDDDDSESKAVAGATTRGDVVVKSMTDCVRLSTVDNFQGNESDLIFISTVRSNPKGNTGFLKTFNRVNVMLSRAKQAMYILGSATTVRRSGKKAEMFNNVLDILQETGAIGRTIGLKCHRHGTVTHVATPQEIRERTPDGGCLVQCDQRLRCGHSCPKLCHADDERHVAVLCMEPCVKSVSACGHLCKARCHEPCRCIETIASYDLPCGHSVKNIKCHTTHGGPARVVCPFQVEVELPFCQHTVRLSCAQARTLKAAIEQKNWQGVWQMNVRCTTHCGLTQAECTHECWRRCGDCLAANLEDPQNKSKIEMEQAGRRAKHLECTHPCGRTLLCGHPCTSACHSASQCPPCKASCRNQCTHSKCSKLCKDACASCAEPCVWTCVHTGEQCQLPCGSPCTRLPCDERCPRPLPCGHQCPGLCGEQCLPSTFCRECPTLTNADTVVDLVMATSLADHDPDESPLVRLRCGHCFTVETLDGWMGLHDYYDQDAHGNWTAVKPLQAPVSEFKVKNCPTCRLPIAGVNRYGRVTNFFHLYQSELKYLQSMLAKIGASQTERRDQQLDKKARNKLVMQFRKLTATPTPTEEASTKERSRFAALGEDADALNLNSFRSIMQRRAVVLAGIELLELLLDTVQDLNTSLPVAKRAFNDAMRAETNTLNAAIESSAHRSAMATRVVGMQLRVASLDRRWWEEEERDRILTEVENARRAILASNPPPSVETRERVDQLWTMAQRVGHLTQAEKDAIFQVFAKGNDAFAQGFGGSWYQCPNGHPYVITECGGAMQRSQCPECGAVIGGEGHRLDASNTDARAFFTS